MGTCTRSSVSDSGQVKLECHYSLQCWDDKENSRELFLKYRKNDILAGFKETFKENLHCCKTLPQKIRHNIVNSNASQYIFCDLRQSSVMQNISLPGKAHFSCSCNLPAGSKRLLRSNVIHWAMAFETRISDSLCKTRPCQFIKFNTIYL